MIKYGLIEKVEKQESVGQVSGYDVAEYRGNLYHILLCDTDIKTLVRRYSERKRPRLKGKIAKFNFERKNGIPALEILDIITNTKSELEYERIRKLREEKKTEALTEFKSFLTGKGVHSAMDLLYLSGRHLRSEGGTIGTIIGRTVHDIGTQEKLDICKELGWDLYGEIRELLQTKAGVTSALSLVCYGHHKFVSTFGLKMVSLLNGYYNRGKTSDLIVFAERLGRDIKSEVKAILKDARICCGIDMVKGSYKRLLPYKGYLGLVIDRSLNAISLDDRCEIAEKLGRNIPQEIVAHMSNSTGSTFKKVRRLKMKQNTIPILDRYQKNIEKLLGHDVKDDVLLDIESDLTKRFDLQTTTDYMEKITTRILIKQLGVQMIGFVLGRHLKEISFQEKCELGEKIGLFEKDNMVKQKSYIIN